MLRLAADEELDRVAELASLRTSVTLESPPVAMSDLHHPSGGGGGGTAPPLSFRPSDEAFAHHSPRSIRRGRRPKRSSVSEGKSIHRPQRISA